jgi:mono/diheme cytochrome c family protein
MPCRLALFALVLVLAGCRESTPPYPERQPPQGFLQQPANIAAGAEIFASHCARCHGTPGEGRSPRANFFQPPSPDFTDPGYRRKDPAYLFWRITKGKTVEPYLSRGSVMPAWGPYFSDSEIWQLVAYLRSRSTE